MTSWTEPDDAVLLELGRLTWAAINLEDVIPTVRRAIGPEPPELARAPVSTWIKDALSVLATWPESPTRGTAVEWFGAAREALEKRNCVLHSVPATFVHISGDGAVTAHGAVLDHIPARRGGSVRRTPLTEDALRCVHRQLAGARTGWVELCEGLARESAAMCESGP